MPDNIDKSDIEPDWQWRTRVTNEAASVALAKGRTPQERFEIFDQLVMAACQERERLSKDGATGSGTGKTPKPISSRQLYDYVESPDRELSGFDQTGDI